MNHDTDREQVFFILKHRSEDPNFARDAKSATGLPFNTSPKFSV